jgi:hypothetical protein
MKTGLNMTNLLRQIALQVHRFRLPDMGSLASEHGQTGMPVKIVILVLPPVVDQEILFFRNELQDVSGTVFKGRGQLYGQSRTRLLAKPSIDATAEIDPEPRGIAAAILTFSRLHGDAAHRADPRAKKAGHAPLLPVRVSREDDPRP